MTSVGTVFAGYELLELVGESGMGTVYRALDIRLARPVALRLVPPEIASDPLARARLNREATALAAVDHPHVPPIYEAGEHEGRIFIASRWVDGLALDRLVREQGPLDPRRAVRIADQVAAALQAVHELGIMHRDVKPSSVLVTTSDHAYLTDFAVARRLEDRSGLTAQMQLLGKVDYLAPEYLAGQEPDVRVDIYGLGCVLYEALTGEVPFPAAGDAAKMYAHASTQPPSLRARRPELPERLDEVVRRALAKDPDERQQSAAQFALQAAGAVDLSGSPWALRSLAMAGEPGQDGARAARADRDGEADGVATDYFEPVFYMNRGRGLRHRLLLSMLAVLFLAAPVALALWLLTR